MRFILFLFPDLLNVEGVQAEGERTNRPSPMRNSGEDYYKYQACGLVVDILMYWPTLIPNPLEYEGKGLRMMKNGSKIVKERERERAPEQTQNVTILCNRHKFGNKFAHIPTKGVVIVKHTFH